MFPVHWRSFANICTGEAWKTYAVVRLQKHMQGRGFKNICRGEAWKTYAGERLGKHMQWRGFKNIPINNNMEDKNIIAEPYSISFQFWHQ